MEDARVSLSLTSKHSESTCVHALEEYTQTQIPTFCKRRGTTVNNNVNTVGLTMDLDLSTVSCQHNVPLHCSVTGGFSCLVSMVTVMASFVFPAMTETEPCLLDCGDNGCLSRCWERVGEERWVGEDERHCDRILE